jgi:O-antigen/teichoic acid export membrane protein
MGISNVVRALYFKLDSLLLAAMLTTRDVGLYNAAYLLATGTSLASVVVRSIAFPEMSSAFDAGHAFLRVLSRFAIAVVVMGALSFVLVWLVGPWLIDRVFGVEFAAAKELIPVFAGVAAVVFINEAAQATLLATHQQTLDLRCGVFALVLNVGLNLVLIPRIGIAGAAWATLGAETAGALTRVWFGRAHIRTRLQAV